MKKKFFAIVLCMALIVTMLPFNAFAEEAEAQDMNTDISAQEVEQADDAEDDISVAEQERDNEAEENGAVMSASVAAGSIAEVNWDDDGNAEYNVRNESDIYVSAGSESNYFSVGKMESGKFCPAEGAVDSCSITVNRDGWNEPVSKDEPTWSNPLRAGGFEGCYDFDEEALYLGYNENAIFLGEAAYGAYQVTVNWTAGGTEYSAEMVLNLKPAEMLTRGSFSGSPDSWAKEAGFSKSFYINEHIEMKNYIYRLKYAPCIDYENTGKSSTMILSDGEHGILNFKESNCDIEGLFAAGTSVKYKSDVTVTPMTVDYSKVTADIMDKVYMLTFADSAGSEVTCRICFEKDESVDRLEDGRLYAIAAYEDAIAKNGNVYVRSVKSQVLDSVELTVKTIDDFFFVIWRAQTQQFELVEISIDDLVNVSAEKCNGGSYMISSEVSGAGNFKTANGETIRYTSKLPSCGAYSAPEKSDENYLTNQISINGVGKEFYLIVDGNGIEKNELKLNISVPDAFGTSYYGEDTKGDNKYFIWKITASDEFEPEYDEINVNFKILKNNKYYDSTWLYISYTIAAEQQLYWFYDYEASVDSNGIIEEETEDAQYTRIWTEITRTITGYFAVKTESGSYKAVDSVISDAPDDLIITKAEYGYTYNLKSVKEGDYICRATIDGKEYRIKVSFNFPSMGFYSTEDRSIDSSLGNEFHYIDVADENKKEAYFYIITDTCGYELDEVTMTCGRWVKGEWKKKDVTGISIECISDSDKYFVYKVTVSDQYRADGDSELFGLVNDNGERLRGNWIQIYDSTEISPEQQLYWFDSWDVETDSEGKLSLPEGTEYNSLDDAARKRLKYHFILNESYDNKQGYFAIKDSEDNYYAVDTVSAPDTEAVEMSKNGFEYSIRWKEFGEYQFTAEKDGENYRFYLIARLPEMGFYKHPVRISENYYIEEFYFADAAETGNNGKEAYFYIIASTYGYEADNIEIKTRIYNDETYEYEDADVQGISVEKLENIPLDSEDCCVWKVTVTDEYRGGYNNNSYVNFKVMYDEDWWDSESIKIYDSEAISPKQQMYWFYNGDVSVDENGKLTAKRDNTLNQYAEKELSEDIIPCSSRGYFAVKDDNGDYYVLDNVTAPDSDNVELSKRDFEDYVVSWNYPGSYIFKGTRNGKTYKFKLTVNLPSMGFYSHPERTAANYINEFHFADAAEKSKDGTKAYFYVIAKASIEEEEAEDIAVWYFNSKHKQKQKTVKGISFERLEKPVNNSAGYYVWKVTVDKKYREGDNYSHEIGVKYASSEGEYYDIASDYIDIYDSTEVTAEEQLYWFSSRRTSVNSEGFIETATDENLDEMASTRQKYRSKISMRGYFAVKDANGKYRALDAVTVSDSKNVRIGKNGYEYVVSLQNFGEYQITGIYNGKKYKFNLIAVISEVGFYTHEEKTGDNYLGNTIYFNDIPEKNKDKSEAYVYIIAPILGYDLKDVKAGVEIWERNESSGDWERKFGETEGISFGEPQERTFDSEECFVWKVTIGSEYQMNVNGSEDAISIIYGDSEEEKGCDITIYNAETVTPSQQIYYFNSQDVDIVNGKIVFKESFSDDFIWKIGTLTCGDSRVFDCLAIQKDGEYYKVDIADAKGVRYSVNETSGATTLIPEKTGKYTITALYDGKRYYSKGTIVLPNEGFWSEPNRSDETLLKEFNYNTADDKKHFYYIAPSYYFRDADGEIADMKDITMAPYAPGREGSHIEAPGVKIGESGSFTEDEQNYYYWEVIVDKSFNTDSVWGYICMKYDCSGRKGQSNNELKITEYKDYGNSITVSGTVTSGDNTDNAEMLLYSVNDLKGSIGEEYTDSKAEAYIKSDIISSNSHYGSSATEKGRITGINGIYSQAYKFVDVVAGEYKLAVYKPGYGVHIENVTVSDSTVTRDIKLSLLGDANGDGKVRIGDKAILARAIAGWTGYENLLNRDAADINGDGLIKNDDLMILSRHLAGWLGYSQLEYGKQQIKSE